MIGVVGNVHNFDLTSPPIPNLYFPEADHAKTAMTIVLRTNGDPALLSETVRRTLTRQHPDLALFRLQPMETRMAHEIAQRSFLMQVAAAFGALALFLAILGTYGLLAYEVSLREKEIGIRLALGSSREAIVQLLLGQESRWVLLGAAAGLFGCHPHRLRSARAVLPRSRRFVPRARRLAPAAYPAVARRHRPARPPRRPPRPRPDPAQRVRAEIIFVIDVENLPAAPTSL